MLPMLVVGVDLNKIGSCMMHVYRLSVINEALNSADDSIVVCKITNDSSDTPTFRIADCVFEWLPVMPKLKNEKSLMILPILPHSKLLIVFLGDY